MRKGCGSLDQSSLRTLSGGHGVGKGCGNPSCLSIHETLSTVRTNQSTSEGFPRLSSHKALAKPRNDDHFPSLRTLSGGHGVGKGCGNPSCLSIHETLSTVRTNQSTSEGFPRLSSHKALAKPRNDDHFPSLRTLLGGHGVGKGCGNPGWLSIHETLSARMTKPGYTARIITCEGFQ
ncbi:hypothetical protein [uncultured Cyclobacterium sp.]|uniref:hypothetical protein n=1 Tax=uncultured Cyclobacterium sp. TaxID=453820 RepID=UPI0030EB80C9